MTYVHGAHRQRQQVVPPSHDAAALQRERAHLLARVEADAKVIRREWRIRNQEYNARKGKANAH